MAEKESPATHNVPVVEMSQLSTPGFTVYGGRIYEEMNQSLCWPRAIHTYKKMMYDATIAPAISLVETAIAETPWTVKAKDGREKEDKEKVEYIRSLMDDMEAPFSTFIRQAATHHHMGFSLSEKVFRFRRYSEGSRYNDGLVGLRKLAPIPQDTVERWEFGNGGKSLTGLWQNVKPNTTTDGLDLTEGKTEVRIPRQKFMLFRNSHSKDTPEGRSPLNDCYIAWKFKTALEDAEAIGVSSDLRGMKVLYLPPEYLDPNASSEMRAVREYYERGLTALHKNEQSAIILPMMRDEHGHKMFEFELKSVMGQKSHSTNEIINRLKKEIITSLHASQLVLGQEGGGSYSLAESQSNISKTMIEARLREIKDQLNHDLIPQIYKLNGWSMESLPYFDYGEVNKESLDEISKYVQRVAAVGLVPKTAEMVNWLTSRLGVKSQFTEDQTTEEITPLLTGYTSGAAEGLDKLGNGTSDNVSVDDNSIGNLENS